MPLGDESASWDEARALRDEHERLAAATAHVARAVAELTRAMALVGDHVAAVPLREALEQAQLLQAQLATASEKAFSLGRLATRRAQHEALQRQVRQAGDEPPSERGLPDDQ
jgi:uncharacterized protein with GYD domain